jgi:hypothetical protein
MPRRGVRPVVVYVVALAVGCDDRRMQLAVQVRVNEKLLEVVEPTSQDLTWAGYWTDYDDVVTGLRDIVTGHGVVTRADSIPEALWAYSAAC